jgi:hypothetical protein
VTTDILFPLIKQHFPLKKVYIDGGRVWIPYQIKTRCRSKKYRLFAIIRNPSETSFINCSGCCREISGPRIIYPFAIAIVLLETSVNQEFVLGLNEKNLFEVV